MRVLYRHEEITNLKLANYKGNKSGFHIDPVFGRVHRISGSDGLSFFTSGGQRIFIGIRKITAIRHVLEHHFKYTFKIGQLEG